MSDVTWLVDDGQASTWSNQRACQFGDGLFETLAVIEGLPCLWPQHLERLWRGCQRLHLPLPDADRLEQECLRACKGLESAALKIFWTSGRSTRGYRRPTPISPTCLIQIASWTPPDTRAAWNLTLCDHRLSENPALAGIKHLNRLDQVLGRSEWAESDIDEGLMLGQDDRIICGTMSNIFIEREGELVTPQIAGAGVAGVVRQCLFEESQRLDIPISVARLTVSDIASADAVYMTNALVGIRRVAQFRDTRFDLSRPVPDLIDKVRELAFKPGGGLIGASL